MLEHGEVPRYVPNWWNPYSQNVGEKDPARKQKLIVILKLVFVVITMLGGATLALCLNVLMPANQVRSKLADKNPCLERKLYGSPLNPSEYHKLDQNLVEKKTTTTAATIQDKSTKNYLIITTRSPYRRPKH